MIGPVVFGVLLFGHALADYPLQGDFLARAKNRANPIPGVPWYHGLGWHAIIHGGVVFFALASISATVAIGCALAETAAHALIDDAKCTGKFGAPERSFNIDQGLHVACKFLWATIAVRAL